MGPLERESARRRGQRKLDAMKRRAGLLRRRVVATAIVGFALLWTVVFVQMATGNDPALGTGAATARSGAREKAASGAERRSLQAAVPPPSKEESEESPAVVEPEATETAAIEAEQAEVERIEAEQREAETRELEELEALTTGQS